MKRFLMIILVLLTVLSLTVSADASEMSFTAPEVPESGRDLMPDAPETFSEGLRTIMKEAVALVHPALAEAAQVCVRIIATVLLLSFAQHTPGATKQVLRLAGVVAMGAVLLQASNAMIRLGADTILELSNYGKLLLPVLTAAVAAQGGATTAAALYTGTVFFDTVLSSIISSVLIPAVYIFLALAVANSALGEGLLGKLRDTVKSLAAWFLKTLMYIFTGYMGITGVVSGSADAAAIKAAKVTISGAVPVVGGILSDASEAILVSAGVMKNAAGIYGILAITAVCIGPFIEIGVQYLLLKLTAAVCDVFGNKETVELIRDFTSAMGLVLAMTGAVSLLLLISAVCFMKGAG